MKIFAGISLVVEVLKNLEEKIVVNGLDKVFLIDHLEIKKMLEMISVLISFGFIKR